MAQETKTKTEKTKLLLVYLGLLVAAFLTIALLKPFYVVLLVFWGVASSFPMRHWMSNTGWQFSRLEWFIMAGCFCIGLVMLLVTWQLYPSQL